MLGVPALQPSRFSELTVGKATPPVLSGVEEGEFVLLDCKGVVAEVFLSADLSKLKEEEAEFEGTRGVERFVCLQEGVNESIKVRDLFPAVSHSRSCM